MPARALRFAVIGDDFTPASLFEKALRHVLDQDCLNIEIVARDLKTSELVPYESGDVKEAFGEPGQVAELARGCHFLLTTFAPVTRAVLEAAPTLLAIACGRGGPINVDMKAATERGVTVLFAKGRNAESVAEYSIAAILMLLRQIPAAVDMLRQARWVTPLQDSFEKPSGPELANKKVGIIGFGQIGRRVAQLVSAFGAKVMVCGPSFTNADLEQAGIVGRFVTLEELLEESDIISIHARLPQNAKPVLTEAEFARMKRKPIIINTARAHVIDNKALVMALRAGRIAAACLDVFQEEPISLNDELLKIDPARLMLTPHVAGMSSDVPETTAQILADGISALIKKVIPKHVANPSSLQQCWNRLASLA